MAFDEKPNERRRRAAQALRLSDSLSFRLSVLSNTISGRIAEAYEERFGLSLWQWRVMAVLGEVEPLTASAIVERTAMDKVAVSRAVTSLERKQLLERQVSQADKRRQVVRLTGKGRSTYETIAPQVVEFERAMSISLGETDRKRLLGLLDELASFVSPDQPLW